MRKLFLSLVALLVMTIVGQAANTISFETKSTTAKSLGKYKDTIPTFKLGPVTFLTDNSGSTTYKNGWMRNDSSWTIYRDHGDGPLNVKADEGYWIKDLTMTYYENSYGILSTVAGASQSKNPLLASNYPILFNSGERQFYVGKTRADGGGFLCISKFVVSYFAYPTSMTMEDMTISVGNQFQVIPTFSPANSFAWCDWESDNTNVVEVNNNGIINAKTAGTANLTATFGSLSTSCKITVVTTDDESLYDDFSEYGTTTSFNKNASGKQTATGLWWILRNWQRSATTDLIDGVQGTQIQYMVNGSNRNYFAYDNSHPMEGGVKRVSFQWRAVDSTKNVMFNLDDCTNSPVSFYTFLPAGAENVKTHTITQDINQAKNYQFRLRISDQASSNIVFGPLTITPYLYYKTKTAEANGKYTNEDLINNTLDTATVVYTLEDNDGEASIDAATGEVTCLAEGEVTVRATWGAVSTTYTLKTHVLLIPEMNFAADTVNKDFFDAPFINALTTTAGVGDTTYTSSNKQVATVATNGEVTIVGVGQTTITASVAATSTYAAKSASYVLNVTFAPATGTFWKETFSKRDPNSSKNMNPIETVGDSAVYNWVLTNYDYNKTDVFDGVIGVRVRYDGSIVNEFMEGGVKALAFDWRASNNTNYIHYTVKTGEETTVFDSDPIPTSVTNRFTFARKYEQKSNTSFKFTIDTAGLTNTVAFLGVGPITIVPYLLYTQKYVTLNKVSVGSTYTNNALINNAEGDVVYTVDGGSEIATIDAATGEVTVQGEGTVTVQATWGDVYTTYTLNITGTTTRLNEVDNAARNIRKVMMNEHVYILRGGTMYDLQGNKLN